jgi:predicted metalloprotease with PDZ domain
MNYRLSFEAPQQHLIQVELDLSPSGEVPQEVRLSKWRPGRYELGPYIENIANVQAVTQSGRVLAVTKTAYNHWSIAPSGDEAVVLSYTYYAVALDAGASYFGHDQVYLNGVNLFLYQPDRIDEPCRVALRLPADYQLATGMRHEGHTLLAADFHELVDCPVIASPSLQHYGIQVAGVTHHIWFQGEVKPDMARMAEDFGRFGAAQTALFGGFPAEEYHYLFQVHPRSYYHGVEHQNSTVLAFGPGFRFMQPEFYREVLGLCSHELFHAWNVKAIRPADMRPYDYDRMNYSRLHYVTEGVTTYYGDLMLLKSGVWTLEEFLDVFNESTLKKHYANDGRRHMSLEDASFDSWINGYKPGVPNRKISFYTKGALAAFALDYLIRRGSRNARSLDTVMREMYERFGRTGIGYTRADYQAIAEAHCGLPLDDYFRDYISGTVPMEPLLAEAAAYFGLLYLPRFVRSTAERLMGMGVEEVGKALAIKQLWEGGPAVSAGLSVGDELVAVNGFRVEAGGLDVLLSHFSDKRAYAVSVFRNDRLLHFDVPINQGYDLERYLLLPQPDASPEQLENRARWAQVF